MTLTRLFFAAMGALVLLGGTDASAARHRDRHPGHVAHPRIATYTMPARPRHVLRTAQAGQPVAHARAARVRQDTSALQATRAQARTQGSPRLAQGPRYHPLMRGS